MKLQLASERPQGIRKGGLREVSENLCGPQDAQVCAHIQFMPRYFWPMMTSAAWSLLEARMKEGPSRIPLLDLRFSSTHARARMQRTHANACITRTHAHRRSACTQHSHAHGRSTRTCMNAALARARTQCMHAHRTHACTQCTHVHSARTNTHVHFVSQMRAYALTQIRSNG